jgi:hypothetical protein
MTPEEMLVQIEREAAERSWESVEQKIDKAIAYVMERDRELIEDGPSERAVAHRLAVYLEWLFEGWHIDCEFNRQGDDRDPKKIAERRPPPPRPNHRRTDRRLVLPDIVVHRRRSKNNLLVIEVKEVTNAGIPEDRIKLREFLTDDKLKYSHAVLVVYRSGANAGFEKPERIAPI